MSWRTNTRQLINAVSERLCTVEARLLKITCEHKRLEIDCLGEDKACLFCTDCKAVIQVGTYVECKELLQDHRIELAKKKMDDAIKAYDNLVVEAKEPRKSSQ